MSRRLGHGHTVWYRYGASTPRFNHHSKGAPALLLEVALAYVRLRAGEVITRDAGSAMSPFGSGRPVRPWLVVNLGGGTVAPRAAWLHGCNIPAEIISPPLRGFLGEQIISASRLSTLFRPLHGTAQPGLRRTDHNKDALARPCSTRKEKTSWLTSAPSPQRKTASPASSVP